MKTAALLVVLLSNQGFWFAQQEGTITIAPVVGEAVPAGSELAWELVLDSARVASGTVALPGGDHPAVVRIAAPRVRVPTTLTWRYGVTDAMTGREVTRGKHSIHVFPDDLLADTAGRLQDRQLLVVDPRRAIAAVLERAKVPHVRLDDIASLRAAPKGQLIVVAPDAVNNSPFAQGSLLDHAKSGAGVFVFVQSKPQKLAGYALADRVIPTKLMCEAGHALLRNLSSAPLMPAGAMARAIQLRPDEPALAIVRWPAEAVEANVAAPMDALLVTKSIGEGRIVLCQLPLADFQTDPRAQLLLRNAIEYLVMRPEPTSPPSRRARPKPPAAPASVPTIEVLPGVTQ